MRARVLLVLGVSWSISGCGGCKKDRPYTPYAVSESTVATAGAPPAPDAAAVPVGLAVDGGAFVHVVAGPPSSPDGNSFAVDAAITVQAPPGERFALALAADLDGDAVRDVAAWATSADPLAGRLLFYKGVTGGAPRAPLALAALGPGVIGAAGCTAETGLEQIGPNSVAVSVKALCPAPAAPDKKVRWIAVCNPTGQPVLRQEIRLGDPPGAERLAVEIDGSDRDGDRHDDLLVRISLEGGGPPFEPGPRVSADLLWLDRPTGLSRDQGEPEVSLRRAAAAELSRSTKKAEAALVQPAVQKIRHLFRAVCSDSGAAVLSVSSGAIRCGSSKALEEAGAATVRAALTMGDIPRAIASLERIAWTPAAITAARRAELEKAITKAAPVRSGVTVRMLSAAPDFEPAQIPAWGPLTFAPSGDLLVRVKGGVSLVNVTTGQETAASGIPSWPLAVTSVDGMVRWLSLFDPCDGIALRVRMGPPSEPASAVPGPLNPAGGGREIDVPIAVATPGRCTPGAPPVRLNPTPIAWDKAGLETWMAGEPVLVSPDMGSVKPLSPTALLGQPAHAGSPRSPDGRSFAVGTRLGALVRTPTTYQIWRPADLQGTWAYSDLRFCTASNDARAVACVRDGRVIAMLAAAP
jgi:hypothetical protein